jgi:uncharacterized surface protein with fasciclin (FAS1) repeats
MHFHFTTIVWGEWHRSVFTALCLPSLVAPNNLPALRDRARLTYVIHTTRHDAIAIRRAPIIAELERLVELKIIVHKSFVGADIYGLQHNYRHREQLWAEERGAFLLQIPPDLVGADGFLALIAELYEAGKRAIYIRPIRVCSETFSGDILARFPPGAAGAIAVPPRELCAVAFDNLHPWAMGQLVDGPDVSVFPEWLSWEAASDGQIGGFLCAHPFPTDFLFIGPDAPHRIGANQVIDESRDFDDIAFVTDSDRACLVSLLPLLSYDDWYVDRGPIDAVNVARVAQGNGNWSSRIFSRTMIRYRRHDTPETAWRAAERIAVRRMSEIMVLKEYFRLWRLCRDGNHTLSAQLLAAAIHADRPLPRFDVGGGLTIFVPNDAALTRANALENVLSDGISDALLQRFAGHVVRGLHFRSDLDRLTGTLRSVAGSDLTIRGGPHKVFVNDHEIVSADVEAGAFVMHVIDGVLA